jgi:hypothetical protein
LKLVGFGCSFTYGSELQAPNVPWDRHHANTRYRESKCWLGLLANKFQCEYDNRAEPANSNFAIAQQVADYFINLRDPSEPIAICIGWSERTRMSWYSDHWTHNGFAGEQDGWFASTKEWVTFSTNASHSMFTQNAKLIVNSICQAHAVPILQFNALGIHEPTRYANYFADGASMDSMLKRAAQDDESLDLFASGGHPNEAGHEYFTKRLYLFAKERIIV